MSANEQYNAEWHEPLVIIDWWADGWSPKEWSPNASVPRAPEHARFMAVTAGKDGKGIWIVWVADGSREKVEQWIAAFRAGASFNAASGGVAFPEVKP